jgi:hypothetical protein
VEREAEREEGEQGEEVSPVFVGRPLLCRQRTQRLHQTQLNSKRNVSDPYLLIPNPDPRFFGNPDLDLDLEI